MAVRDQIITTLVEGLAALQNRVNEVEALKRTAGPQGERGPEGPPPSDEAIREAATRWLAANITQPEDGKDGADGKDGLDGERGPMGPPPTQEEIDLAVSAWMEINRASLRGDTGLRGERGADGDAGPAGPAGPRGPAGRDGAAGADGVGIALVEQREPQSFYITLSDGQEFRIDLPEPLKASGFGGGGANIYDIDAYFNSVAFNLNPTPVEGAGIVQWNSDFQTLTFGINDGSITHHVGLELYFRIKADSAIEAGQVVMFTGSVGASGLLTGAPANNVPLPEAIMGIAAQDIAENDFGFVQWFGAIRHLQTDGSQYGEDWQEGDILWYDPTVVGGLTKTLPPAPNIHISMAAVIKRSGGNSGILFVRPTIRSALANLSDVTIDAPADGEVLTYDATLGIWTNGAGGGVGGTGTVTSVGGTGTVTSVGLTAPVGFTVSGSPVTTSGTLTLAFDAGYSLPTTADVAQGVTAYSWGDHSLAGYALSSSLSAVATSGLYSDLTGAPTIPTATSDLTNDSGFITIASVPTATSDLTNDSGFITSAAIPTAVSAFTNDAGYLTAESDPVFTASVAAAITSTDIANWNAAYTATTSLAAVATSGSYSDLSGTPTIPTATSQLTNDSGFLTSSDTIDGGTF